jgi:uncharacterized membrane protein (UPF0136 family)
MAVGIALIVYGVVVLAGGIMGFRMAGSRASLTMGSATGLMLVISGILALLGNRSGAYWGMGVTGALILVFGRRYLESQKMMPAGYMLAASVIVAAILYAQLGT